MIELFFKLFIAHLAGDFIIFRNKRLKQKGRPLWVSTKLVVHSIVHFGLAWIALAYVHYWWLALAIGFSHYPGELIIRFSLSRRPQWAFISDQLFHVALIAIIAGYVFAGDSSSMFQSVTFNISWASVAGLIAVTFPAAKFIEIFLARWPSTKSADKVKGLVNAGLWIGILERILIYIFIVTGHWEGIGFLLAAKSVFRFGDLTNSKDISLTEYIMVGTLLSFCLSVVAGLITNYFVA